MKNAVQHTETLIKDSCYNKGSNSATLCQILKLPQHWSVTHAENLDQSVNQLWTIIRSVRGFRAPEITLQASKLHVGMQDGGSVWT